jgi:hypothetical protein
MHDKCLPFWEKGKDIGEFFYIGFLFVLGVRLGESFGTKVRRVLPNFCPTCLSD